MKSTGIPVPDLLETAIQSMGLRDVSPFDIEDKVIGLPTSGGPLMNLSALGFVDEVSRETPAPGGGSVAALAGALGGALTSMVANLSIGKSDAKKISIGYVTMFDRFTQTLSLSYLKENYIDLESKSS